MGGMAVGMDVGGTAVGNGATVAVGNGTAMVAARTGVCVGTGVTSGRVLVG